VNYDKVIWCGCGQEALTVYEIDFDDADSCLELGLMKSHETSLWRRIGLAWKALMHGSLYAGDIIMEPKDIEALGDYLNKIKKGKRQDS